MKLIIYILNWHPWSLLSGKWRIEALEISKVHMLRAPDAEKKDVPKSFALPSLPNVKFKKIDIAEIITDPAVTGRLQRLKIYGAGDSDAYNFSAESLEGPETELQLQVSRDWNIHWLLHEANGGLISTALKLPAEAAVSAELRAEQFNDILKLTSLEIKLGNSSVSGGGEYNSADEKISGRFNITIPDSRDFSALAETELSGEINADITVAGSATSPEIGIAANSEKFTVADKELLSPLIEGKLAGSNVTFQASANYSGKPASLKFSGEFEQQHFTTSDMIAFFGPYNFSGDIDADF